ncbi:MAG TPA: hypothetical protein VIH75_10815 [Candidatus Sulfotelmatobacter sp.]
MLLEQAEDKFHCLLPVTVLGEAEGLVELARQGGFGGPVRVLCANISSGSQQRRKKQDCPKTIYNADNHIKGA